MSNRIIVPANYTIEVIIRVDPVNGQSDLMVRNRSKIQLTMWQIAGLLTEHAAHVMHTLLTNGKVKQTPVEDKTPSSTPPTTDVVQ